MSSEKSTAHLVFVYGTLRRGCSNNDSYMTGAEWLGTFKTIKPYALYVGDYPYVAADEAVSPIVGEVWLVDDEGLKRLDGLEQHPDWYRREEVLVKDDGGRTLTAWLYFYPRPEGELIPSGDYLDHPSALTAGRIDPID